MLAVRASPRSVCGPLRHLRSLFGSSAEGAWGRRVVHTYFGLPWQTERSWFRLGPPKMGAACTASGSTGSPWPTQGRMRGRENIPVHTIGHSAARHPKKKWPHRGVRFGARELQIPFSWPRSAWPESALYRGASWRVRQRIGEDASRVLRECLSSRAFPHTMRGFAGPRRSSDNCPITRLRLRSPI